MAIIHFQNIKFEKEGKGSFAMIRADFLKIFRFYLDPKDLECIGKFELKESNILFKDIDQSTAERKFSPLLSKGFATLKNSVNGKPAIYVHRNSGIPLLGHIAFGIVDRGTNIIELKPITGCNIKCVYCSVNEDVRPVDFVVECDYLLDELAKIIRIKGCSIKDYSNIGSAEKVFNSVDCTRAAWNAAPSADDFSIRSVEKSFARQGCSPRKNETFCRANDINIHIGTQGEPLYYAPMLDLLKGLRAMPKIKEISISTNGMFLTKRFVDELIAAGLTQFNISLNSLDQQQAKELAGAEYNLKHILEIIEYIGKQDVNLIITPVWVAKINDAEMPKLIEFAKNVNAGKQGLLKGIPIGIQNYLYYPFGRKPGKEISFDEFYNKLEKMEAQHQVKLIFKSGVYKKTAEIPKPFKKGEVIEAVLVSPGRLRNELIAAAKDRCISVFDCDKKVGSRIKLKITRTKHNVYSASQL